MQKYLRISKKSSTFARFFVSKHSARCHRITVSTQDFHSCNRGSIPLGTTKTFPKVNIPKLILSRQRNSNKTVRESDKKQKQRWQIIKAL